MKLTLQVYRPDTRRWVSHLTLAASDANERKIEAERERLEAAGYRVRERVGWWFRGGGGVSGGVGGGTGRSSGQRGGESRLIGELPMVSANDSASDLAEIFGTCGIRKVGHT
jgi:hypothetical protein